MHPGRGELRIFEHRVLRVRSLSVVLEFPASSGGCDRRRPFCSEDPLNDVDLVSTEVRHLPARIVPEPPEMVQRAMRIVGPGGSRTEPHVVIEIARRNLVRRLAESRHDIAHGPHAGRVQLAYIAGPEQVASALVMRTAA